MRWRVYYADGSTFSDSDGSPEHAPGLGVLIVAYEDPTPGPQNIGRVYRFGRDFYCWRGFEWGWTGQEHAGLIEYLASPGFKKVLFGVEVRSDVFARIKIAAEADMYLPPRSVRNPEGYGD